MTIAVIRFPGTNNEHDVLWALRDMGVNVELVPHYFPEHLSSNLIKGIIIPGGFSYGDYLRPGAIAARTTLASVLRELAESIPILGVCNGYQILTEMGLLDGVLLPNRSTKFICDWVNLRVEDSVCPFLDQDEKVVIRLPIAHFEGAYEVDDPDALLHAGKIVFRYCTEHGRVDPNANPNGSNSNIAGTCSENGTIVGLMPHPERAVRPQQGSCDGRTILQGFLRFAQNA